MKTTAPKELGILVVAGVFGLIGGGVALVAYDVSFVASLFVAGLVAVFVALVLWLGWREPKARNVHPGQTSDGQAIGVGGTATTAAGAANAAHRAASGPEGARGPGNAPTAAGASTSAAATGSTAAAATGSAAAGTTTGKDSTAAQGAGSNVSEPVTAFDGGTAAVATGGPAAGSTEGDSGAGAPTTSGGATGTDTGSATGAATTGAATAAKGGDTAASGKAKQAEVKPSAKLAGQEDLANRKGDWKYDAPAKGKSEADAQPGAATDGAASNATANPGAKGASEAEAKPGAATDGKADTAGASASSVDAAPTEADKPATLSAARDGGPDNLKEIKGVGPKLETMLHDMGFYHFDQVAAWTDKELAWVDSNLTGFKGRASRDNWVSQAKILASGGETAFSKKVDKGGVY